MSKGSIRLLLASAFFLLASALSLHYMSRLMAYNNVVEFVFHAPPDGVAEYVKNLRIREIESFTVAKRNTNIFASVSEGRYAEVSAYVSGPELFTIIPLRILHGSVPVEKGQIIIGEELAAELFSYTDCLGMELFLNGIPYTVAGVTVKQSFLIGVFGSLEKHAVYIYTDDMPFLIHPERTSLLLKCRENTAGMVLSRLSGSGLNADAEINHDARARFAVFLTRLALLIGLCLPLYTLARRLSATVKKAGLRKLYCDRMTVLNACAASVLLTGIVYLLSGLRLVLDARMIPPSLFPVSGIADTVREWFYLSNSGIVSGGMLGPALRVYACIAAFFAAAALFAGWRIKRSGNDAG